MPLGRPSVASGRVTDAGAGGIGERQVRLADGRTLEVIAAGPADRTPLVFHHGTPSAAVAFAPFVAAAADNGLRAVFYSRPGYAASTPQPGRTVAGAAHDVAAILDALGATTFYTIGWSGGGPHALACAALLPERCLAAATLAGVAPYRAEGLDWLAGMGPENLEEFELVERGAEALTPFLVREAAKLADLRGPDVAAALGGLVSDVDRAALTADFADFNALAMRRSLSTGIAGWRDDDLAFVADWGFDLRAITRPVAVWQGGEDRMVPAAHGEWLAAHVRGARRRIHPGEGHLSLAVGRIREIVADLLALAH